MEVMSPNMMETESIPSRKAKASTGFMLNVKGSMSASVVGAEMPGRIPMRKPITIPSIISGNVGQVNTCVNPEMDACTRESNASASP